MERPAKGHRFSVHTFSILRILSMNPGMGWNLKRTSENSVSSSHNTAIRSICAHAQFFTLLPIIWTQGRLLLPEILNTLSLTINPWNSYFCLYFTSMHKYKWHFIFQNQNNLSDQWVLVSCLKLVVSGGLGVHYDQWITEEIELDTGHSASERRTICCEFHTILVSLSMKCSQQKEWQGQ